MTVSDAETPGCGGKEEQGPEINGGAATSTPGRVKDWPDDDQVEDKAVEDTVDENEDEQYGNKVRRPKAVGLKVVVECLEGRNCAHSGLVKISEKVPIVQRLDSAPPVRGWRRRSIL
jgi:hypothetical protein